MLSSYLTPHAWQVIAKRLELSPRELEVTIDLCSDLKELAIAHRLKISPHTVHTHIGRLHEKLSVKSHAQLIARIFSELLDASCDADCELPPICWRHSTGLCPLAADRPST
jgi:DNA-binding CsgD family transcriptional regulator